jgi:hypothetical protein
MAAGSLKVARERSALWAWLEALAVRGLGPTLSRSDEVRTRNRWDRRALPDEIRRSMLWRHN